jgi:hypothetical protein
MLSLDQSDLAARSPAGLVMISEQPLPGDRLRLRHPHQWCAPCRAQADPDHSAEAGMPRHELGQGRGPGSLFSTLPGQPAPHTLPIAAEDPTYG